MCVFAVCAIRTLDNSVVFGMVPLWVLLSQALKSNGLSDCIPPPPTAPPYM